MEQAGAVVGPATHTDRLYLMYLTGGHPTFPISKTSQIAQFICLVPMWYWHVTKTCIQTQETENCPSAASKRGLQSSGVGGLYNRDLSNAD